MYVPDYPEPIGPVASDAYIAELVRRASFSRAAACRREEAARTDKPHRSMQHNYLADVHRKAMNITLNKAMNLAHVRANG